MKKDRNRNFLSILSRPKADLYDEMDTESPEVEARRRLELRIEQVLGTLVEAGSRSNRKRPRSRLSLPMTLFLLSTLSGKDSNPARSRMTRGSRQFPPPDEPSRPDSNQVPQRGML